MRDTKNRRTSQITLAVILLIFDLLYLILVGITFIVKMDLVSNKGMQFSLHITVILSTIAYLLFVLSIYRTENNKKCGLTAFIFSVLFSILIFIGRSAGILALFSSDVINNDFNFYGDFSISRNIELFSWTTLFPVSVLFLAIIFLKKGKYGSLLSGLCFASAICCFIAFMCFFSSNIIFLLIGITGWGALFILIIVMYIIDQVKKEDDYSSPDPLK
jgi:hypothetical protein